MVADVFAVLVPLAFVQQVQVDAFVQECQLTQAVGQDVVLVFRREREDTAVGFEGDRGSAIIAGADHFDRRSRSAFAVRLAEYFAVAVDFGDEQRRECVHARNTHAVQTARNLVAALVELAARMEHGEHDFECGLALFFVEVGRDASAVILDCDRVVFVDRNVDVGTVSCQRLVDRVIHHLVNQVVQTFSPMSPIYMAGRFRTASRPSRTWMLEAEYSSSCFFISFPSVLILTLNISYKYTEKFRKMQ